MSDSSTHLKTFKYRLYPSKAQARNLQLVLDVSRNFYNMCVGERKWAWELERRSVGKTEQLREVKHYKRTFIVARQVHSHVLQVVAADVDKAYQAFFRRVKAGQKAGYPRFKGRQWFDSFGLKEYGNGFKIDGKRLKLFGIGRVPVRWHRPIEGTIKTVRIRHQAGKWYACFTCEVPTPEPLPETGRVVGLDMGISALVTTSDGVKIDNPNFYRAGQKRLRLLQRKLARAKHRSANRRRALLAVQRQQERVANQRRDYLNKLVYALVQHFDSIAVEDLRIKNMVRNHRLSKSILDSGWGYFAEHLHAKAESAGRTVGFVDPRNTSKCCSNCGAVFQNFDLSTRWVTCACGLSLDRDHNAAINILNRAGWVTPVRLKTAPLLLPDGMGKRISASEATRL